MLLPVVILSPSNMALVKMTDAGVCLPRVKTRLVRGASDWNRCAKSLAAELGISFLNAIKIDGAGLGFLVVSAAGMADVQSHAWLSASQVQNSDLVARHKECISAAVDAAEQSAMKPVTRFNGVLITEEKDSDNSGEGHSWSRTDRGAGAYKGLITTDCAAPEWHMVTRRVTTDITTGELLDDISVTDPL